MCACVNTLYLVLTVKGRFRVNSSCFVSTSSCDKMSSLFSYVQSQIFKYKTTNYLKTYIVWHKMKSDPTKINLYISEERIASIYRVEE